MLLKRIICAIVLSCITFSVLAREELDRIIATVNKDVISLCELDNYIKIVTLDAKEHELPTKDILRRQVLNKMILDKIQLQLADEYGIDVDSVVVSQSLQSMAASQNISMQELQTQIESKNVNFADYRELLKQEIIMSRLQSREVAQDVVISKSDIESYLNSPAGQDQSGTEYHLGHILLSAPEQPTPEELQKTQQEADKIVETLKNGEDFAKTAMENSSSQQALKGGDLGWRSSAELPTLFVSFVPSMNTGDIVGPIRSASGFHIIKLHDKRVGNQELLSEYHVRQILLKPNENKSDQEVEATMHKILQQLKSGSDFAKLAHKNSEETRTASKGGDMGWISKKSVLPKFYDVMSSLEENAYSEPFRTDAGWHVIQLLDKRTHYSSNEAAWNKARDVLAMRKTGEMLEVWAKRLRDEANVQIFLDEQSA